MTKRTFTRDQMDEWDLPYSALHTKFMHTSRWANHYEAIIQAEDDGKFYRVNYQEGATECQEDTDYWYDEDEIRGTEVTLKTVTVKKWVDK